MEDWNIERSSAELIQEIRKVVLVAPGILKTENTDKSLLETCRQASLLGQFLIDN
jgi:hypothetical protein